VECPLRTLSFGELRLRKKELDKAAAFHFEQHELHAAEAAKHGRELEEIRIRLDEINRLLSPPAANKRDQQEERSEPGGATKTRASGGPRRFRAEGPTTVIVRLLYEHKEGMTKIEIQMRNGIAIKREIIRKIVERLLTNGDAILDRQKVILTEQGTKLWQASPLFLHSQQNGTSRASQN
jgi:predicted transcriptional regulator